MNTQCGFRLKNSTSDLSKYLSKMWANTIVNYEEFQFAALEMSMPFHRLNRQGLLNKLASYGLLSKFCHLTRNFLSEPSFSGQDSASSSK